MIPQAQKRSPFGLAIGILLVTAPVVVFWYVWSQFAVDVPKWDDHALKNTLLQLYQADSLWGKLLIFFQQHNEHRIVYDRLITWLDFASWGKLSYVRLMVVGNLSLIGLLVLAGAILRQSTTTSQHGLVVLAPVAYLLFNLSQWENMFWGMAALQNFTVVFWVFLSIYLLTFSEAYVAAISVAILATLTSGNGLLIWPIGVIILLLTRRYKPLVYWSSSAALIIGLYFWGYKKPEGNPPVRGSVVDLLKGWFAFNGAAAEALAQRTVLTWCILLGSILVLLSLSFGIWRLLTFAKSPKSQPTSTAKTDLFLLGCLAFVLGTGAIVAWSRTGFGIDLLITSRYKLYSLLLLIIVYMGMVTHANGRLRTIGIVGSLLFSGILAWLSYPAFMDEAIWWRHWMLTNQFNWTYTTNRPVSAIDPTTARWLDNAPAFYDRILTDLYSPATGPSVPLNVQQNKEVITLTDSVSLNPFGRDAGTYLLLRSPKRIYLFLTTPNLLHSLKVQLGLREPFANGFSARILESELEPTTYQLERLLIHPDGTTERYPTDQVVVAHPQVRQEIKKNW